MLGGGDRIAEGRVHDDDALGGGRLDVDIVDANAGAADDLEFERRGDDLLRCLGGRTHGQTLVADNGFLQLLLAQTNLHIGLDAARLKDGDGGGGELIGNQDAGHRNCSLGVSAPPGGAADGYDQACEPGRGASNGKNRQPRVQAALASERLASAKAQSSHGVSASTSAASTVEPHQIRKCGGASRWPATS